MSRGGATATALPVVLYDQNPAFVQYANQEVVRIVGSGGANPVRGTFTARTANPLITTEMLAGMYGGAMMSMALVVGVRAGNDPSTPIAVPHPQLGTPIAGPGVTQFQVIPLPSLGWEQVAATFKASHVFGKSRIAAGGLSTALVPGTTYIWQVVATIQSAATNVNVGANPVTPGFTPDNKTVWVPNSGAATVTPISLGARPLWILNGGMKDILGNPMSWYPIAGATVAVGAGPYQCLVSPNGAYVAVANNTGQTVTIINAVTRAVIGTTAGLGFGPGAKSLAWSSDSTVCWVALPNGTIVPVTAATAVAGGAVTVAAGHNLYMASGGGTVGWVLDLTTAQVFPLTAMTGGAVTVGGAIALASVANAICVSPADGSCWVFRPANNSLVRVTGAGVQSTTVLPNTVTSCTGMAIMPDGTAIWLCDYNTAILGFDTAGLQQSYYTSGGPVAGAYGVALSSIDDIAVTLYNGNVLRVWPNAYMTCDAGNGFPPGQGMSVQAVGVTVP